MSLCPSSNGPLCTGVYSVEVYDIVRDGSVSSVPALERYMEYAKGTDISKLLSRLLSSIVIAVAISRPEAAYSFVNVIHLVGKLEIQRCIGDESPI